MNFDPLMTYVNAPSMKFDYASIKEAMEKMANIEPMPPKQTLHVRNVDGLPERMVEGGLADRLYSIEVRVCRFLPETVKDKDGNDVELLGVLAGPVRMDLDPEDRANRMVLLTGKIVKKKGE
jgi:hypothetical protein